VRSPEEYIIRTSQNKLSNSQLARSIQAESCCKCLQVAGDSHGPTICSKSVGCCLFLDRDILRRSMAEITCLIHIKRTLFNRMEVW